jgi:hypothetical protein
MNQPHILFLISTLINSHLLSGLSESFLTTICIYFFFLVPKFMSVLFENNSHVISHRSEGSRTFSLPEFLGNQHINVARLSALHTGRFYSPGNIPGTHLCYRLSRPQYQSVAGRIKSIKNPCDPMRIQLATFRLVAQCFNKLRHSEARPFSVFSCTSLSCQHGLCL